MSSVMKSMNQLQYQIEIKRPVGRHPAPAVTGQGTDFRTISVLAAPVCNTVLTPPGMPVGVIQLVRTIVAFSALDVELAALFAQVPALVCLRSSTSAH